MADHDRYDWERGRNAEHRDREYGRGDDRERNYQDRGDGGQDRGMAARGADEVRSWFGDDEARRRREIDDQRDRPSGGQNQRDYGANSERARREHGWGNQGQHPDSAWQGGGRQQSAYGDERDFASRGANDWSGNQGGARWGGGSRDYGDESSRRYGNWQYSGGSAAAQTGPAFSGGYGAGNHESGNFRSGGDAQQPGWSNQNRDFGSTGEGRWSGQQFGNASAMQGGGFGGASYGGAFAGRGPRNYQRSDDRVREDVNERLTADPRIDASDIDVRVQNGEVTLSGTVDERRTRRLAEEIIEDLPGVRDVRNEIRVSHGNQSSNHDAHQHVGEQSRGREDGSVGHSGDPQKRDDITTLNTKDPGGRK
jgi:hypothetical protein